MPMADFSKFLNLGRIHFQPFKRCLVLLFNSIQLFPNLPRLTCQFHLGLYGRIQLLLGHTRPHGADKCHCDNSNEHSSNQADPTEEADSGYQKDNSRHH